MLCEYTMTVYDIVEQKYRLEMSSVESTLLKILDDVYAATDKRKKDASHPLTCQPHFDTLYNHVILDRLKMSFGVTGSALD